MQDSRLETAYDDMSSLAGSRVLVTGGTTGIGRATARLLAGQGARVQILGRHASELDDALADLTQVNTEAGGFTADMASLSDVERAFRLVDERLGSLDILVNNAAIGGDSIDASPDEIRYLVLANVVGYMLAARLAVERMRSHGGGTIVNIGSMSADAHEPGSSVYVATKAAIRDFSVTLRKELAKEAIRVLLIEPGATGTDMQPNSPEEQRKAEARGEMLTAEDVARAVEFVLTRPARCDVVHLQLRPHRQEI